MKKKENARNAMLLSGLPFTPDGVPHIREIKGALPKSAADMWEKRLS